MFEDVDEIIHGDVRKRRRRCAFANWIATLTPEDRDKAEQVLNNRAYDCRSLSRYFSTKGIHINDQVLNRHRNGRCCQGL